MRSIWYNLKKQTTFKTKKEKSGNSTHRVVSSLCGKLVYGVCVGKMAVRVDRPGKLLISRFLTSLGNSCRQ